MPRISCPGRLNSAVAEGERFCQTCTPKPRPQRSAGEKAIRRGRHETPKGESPKVEMPERSAGTSDDLMRKLAGLTNQAASAPVQYVTRC